MRALEESFFGWGVPPSIAPRTVRCQSSTWPELLWLEARSSSSSRSEGHRPGCRALEGEDHSLPAPRSEACHGCGPTFRTRWFAHPHTYVRIGRCRGWTTVGLRRRAGSSCLGRRPRPDSANCRSSAKGLLQTDAGGQWSSPTRRHWFADSKSRRRAASPIKGAEAPDHLLAQVHVGLWGSHIRWRAIGRERCRLTKHDRGPRVLQGGSRTEAIATPHSKSEPVAGRSSKGTQVQAKLPPSNTSAGFVLWNVGPPCFGWTIILVYGDNPSSLGKG